MALPQRVAFLSPEDYLQFERAADFKSEYFAGEMFGMAGGSPAHALIGGNVLRELGNRLQSGRCVPYSSDLRIEISTTGLYTYPDVSVICGPLQFSDLGDDIITNPTLIVEVLSDSTEAYDRGTKFDHYRTISTLREYVLVSQKQPLVEVFLRQDDGTWRLTPVRGLESAARLDSLECDLRLTEVYRHLKFPAPPPLKTIRA